MLSVLNETIHGPLNPTVQKDHLKRLFEAQPEPIAHRKAGNESEPEECPECTPTTKWDFFNSLFFSFTAVTTIGKNFYYNLKFRPLKSRCSAPLKGRS